MTRRILYVILVLIAFTAFGAVYAQQDNEAADEEQGTVSEPAMKLEVNKNEYWNLAYHPQIKAELFKLIEYPYFPGGKNFERKGSVKVDGAIYTEDSVDTHRIEFQSDILIEISELKKIIRAEDAELRKEKKSDSEEESESDFGEQPQLKAESDSNAGFNEGKDLAFDGIKNVQIGDILESRNYLEKCSDLIFKWRKLNESPTFMLEVLRSVELTKTESGVYKTAPEVAVQIKRVLGTIARINKNFDFTSRVTLESVLVGDYPRAWLSRMEKQLADLQIRASMLIELNDNGSESLGLGKVDRESDNIPYQRIEFIRIKEPDKYER